MNAVALAQLGIATSSFIAAASSGKAWAQSPSLGKLILTLALYTAGNLVMLRLIRQIGMATAFSVSSLLQLVATSLVAVLWFGESFHWTVAAGIALAIVAVALMTLGPKLGW